MKSSRRSPLEITVITAATLYVLIFALVGWCLVTDDPPPNARDLTFRTRPVSEEENGLTLLRFSKDELYWPGDERFTAVLKGQAWHGDVVEEVLQKNASLLERLETTDFVFSRENRDYWDEEDCFLFLKLPQILALRARAANREGAHERALADAFTLVEFAQKVKNAQALGYYPRGCIVARWGYEQLIVTLSESNPDADLVRSSLERLKGSEPRLRAFQEGLRNCYEFTAEFVDSLPFDNIWVPFEHWAVTEASFLFFKPESTKAELANIIGRTIHHLDTEDLSVPFPRIDKNDLPFLVAHNPRSQGILSHDHQERLQRTLLTERVDYGLTILLLALKAHHLDHGRLPARLEELSPTYVDELPVDPFDGKPLRYDSEGLRIYSIGIDARSKQEGADTVALPEDFNRESLALGLKVTGAPSSQLKIHDPESPFARISKKRK